MAIDKAIAVGVEVPPKPKGEAPEEIVDISILDDGGVEVTVGKEDEDPFAGNFGENLAETIEEDELSAISEELVGLFSADDDSRKEWKRTFEDGLDLLGLKIEDRTEPWDGACGVYHPLLSEAVVRFQSEAITETFPAAGPVKAKILGKSTKEKEKIAARVRDDLNYRLTDEMTEYRPEHERMLWNLDLAGSAFKKVYYDPALGRQCAVFIPAEDFVVSYGTSDISTCSRATHVMRKSENEIKFLQVNGFYRDIDLGEPGFLRTDIQRKKDETTGVDVTEDNRYELLEMHVEYDLGEGNYRPFFPANPVYLSKLGTR